MGKRTNIDIHWNRLALYVGFYYLMVITAVLMLSGLLLLVKIPISPAHLPVSALLAAGLLLILHPRRERQTILTGVVLALVLLAGMMAVSGFIYDVTCDGNVYHKVAVGLLKNGWNPVYQGSETFNQIHHVLPMEISSAIWIDHYAKASWIFGACVYSITNAVESGKIITWLMIVVLFCLGYDYLSRRFLKRWQSILASFLMAVNPITCAQVTSFYVDGLLAVSLFTGVLFLFMLSDRKYDIPEKVKWAGLFGCIVICANIKFTGLVYIGVFCAAFYFYWIVRERKNPRIGGYILRLTAFFVASVVAAVCLVGFSSYVTNVLHTGNPFYPLLGKGAVDIITPYEPVAFRSQNSLLNLLQSTFSISDNTFQVKQMQYKLPFTVRKSELAVSYIPDLRLGGFGVLFGGIFLLTVLILVLGLIRLFKNDRQRFIVCALTIGTIVISAVLVRESWWARYNPLIYILPLMAMIFLFGAFRERNILLKTAALLFAGLMFANTGIFAVCRLKDIRHSIDTRAQMRQLAAYGKDKTVTVSFFDWSASGMTFNVIDLGIAFQVQDKHDDSFTGIDEGLLYYK